MQDDGRVRLLDDRKLRKGGREGGCVGFGARPHTEAGCWCCHGMGDKQYKQG
jgi:hypothetical protein